MKLRQIKHRAYAISARIVERELWKLEAIAQIMGALKDIGFVHDPSKGATEFVPPKSLQVVADYTT